MSCSNGSCAAISSMIKSAGTEKDWSPKSEGMRRKDTTEGMRESSERK
jgi:hypothetical protein